jgi:hypothetical protein
VSTFDLLTYSHLHIGAELCLLSATSQSYKWKVCLVGGFFQTTVDSLQSFLGGDSLAVTGEKRDLLALYLMPEMRVKFFNSDRLDFETAVGVLYAGAVDTRVHLLEGPVDGRFSQTAPPGGLNTKFFSWNDAILKIEADINLHPDPNDKSTAIFLRSILYQNAPQSNLLLQLGYSTPIAKVFAK